MRVGWSISAKSTLERKGVRDMVQTVEETIDNIDGMTSAFVM